MGTKGYGGFVGRTVIMATVSGTVSEATGGKFANGAMTGAFVHMFNGEWSAYRDPNKVAFGTDAERTKAQRVVSEGFDKVSQVATSVAIAGAITKNAPLTIVSGAIATGATTLKYVVSPDNHSSQEIINDYLKIQYQSTDLH